MENEATAGDSKLNASTVVVFAMQAILVYTTIVPQKSVKVNTTNDALMSRF